MLCKRPVWKILDNDHLLCRSVCRVLIRLVDSSMLIDSFVLIGFLVLVLVNSLMLVNSLVLVNSLMLVNSLVLVLFKSFRLVNILVLVNFTLLFLSSSVPVSRSLCALPRSLEMRSVSPELNTEKRGWRRVVLITCVCKYMSK